MAHPQASLNTLPEELLTLIIENLPIKALACLSQTNKLFHRLSDGKNPSRRKELIAFIKPKSPLHPYKYDLCMIHSSIEDHELHNAARMSNYTILPPDNDGKKLIIMRFHRLEDLFLASGRFQCLFKRVV